MNETLENLYRSYISESQFEQSVNEKIALKKVVEKESALRKELTPKQIELLESYEYCHSN